MTNIYVGNLPYATLESELIEHFSQWGRVTKATLVFDRETGRPRGFGFVEMDEDTEAQQAITQAHGAAFNGRPLTVNQARPRGAGTTPPAHHNSRAPHPYGSFGNPSPHRTNHPPSPPASGNPADPSEADLQRQEAAGSGYHNRIEMPAEPQPPTPPAAPTPQRVAGGGYVNHLYS
ncbi:MAG: RNA-binding protein [Planctomycetota bacterium]